MKNYVASYQELCLEDIEITWKANGYVTLHLDQPEKFGYGHFWFPTSCLCRLLGEAEVLFSTSSEVFD